MTAPALPGAEQGTRPAVRVPWVAVAVLAVGMSFADGFWIVSLREAAGAAIRTGRPFASWPSTARWSCRCSSWRWWRRSRSPTGGTDRRRGGARSWRPGCSVAWPEPWPRSSWPSRAPDTTTTCRPAEADQVAATHSHGSGQVSPYDPTCTGSCAIDISTLVAHARGLAYLAPLLLATNVVVVGWVVALRGGRLDAPAGGRQGRPGMDAAH